MGILKWLGGTIGVAQLAVVALVIGARLGDGPIAIIPGGPLESGERVTGAEPDWTFARDIMEMEFQLVEPPRCGRPSFRSTTRNCTSSADA